MLDTDLLQEIKEAEEKSDVIQYSVQQHYIGMMVCFTTISLLSFI